MEEHKRQRHTPIKLKYTIIPKSPFMQTLEKDAVSRVDYSTYMKAEQDNSNALTLSNHAIRPIVKHMTRIPSLPPKTNQEKHQRL
mmetsp:Transcript_2036/g.2776  ORF Transcript_2036/g.2776 Transcript_2036/m.2776 type:complete len:85 (-) Transcript_2036:64-318(-)